MEDFKVLLSLALGLPLTPAASVSDLPMPDFMAYRRFYARHPWGPVWDVRLAWLAGIIGRQVYSRKPTTLDEAMAALLPGSSGRKRKKREPLKPGWLKGLAAAIGAIGPDGKRVTDGG